MGWNICRQRDALECNTIAGTVMCESVIEVKIRALAPVSDGFVLFLGNEEKVFLIPVDQRVGRLS
jgi:hypothetical protein